MTHWEAKGRIWGGRTPPRPAPFKRMVDLFIGEPLVLSFGDEVAIADIFGLHLGYLSGDITPETKQRHAAGELVLAKVIKPATVAGTRPHRVFTKARVLVWTDHPSLYSYEVICDQETV